MVLGGLGVVLGGLGVVLGDPGRVLVDFWRIFVGFWGGPGADKKSHFRGDKIMKLSGIKYFLQKTKNPCLIHGSIKEKLSLSKKIDLFFGGGPARVPGSRHRAREPGRTGKKRKKTNKSIVRKMAGPAAG